MPPQIPILLLKTRSAPEDGYADFFSAHGYTPTFVPVLEHRVHEPNLGKVRALLAARAFSDVTRNIPIRGSERRKFGGLIFTSQRAVEAFAGVLEAEGEGAEEGMVIPNYNSLPSYHHTFLSFSVILEDTNTEKKKQKK